MNINEARDRNLIINSFDLVSGKPKPHFYKLVTEIEEKTLYVTQEDFTPEETLEIINLLEKTSLTARLKVENEK